MPKTLTSGGEGGGSYALGQVHNAVRLDLVMADAHALGRTLTEQFLTPLVQLNLGPTAPIPRWIFQIEEPEDLNATATRVETLGRAGLRIPARWAYEKFGIPEPADDEEVLVASPAGFGLMANAAPAAPAAPAAAAVQRRRTADAPRVHRQNEAEIYAVETELSGLGPMDLHERLNAEPPGELAGPLPEDALAWLGEKRVVNPQVWESLSPAGRQRAWWVTGLSQQRTALVARALIDAIRDGRGEGEFLDLLESLGISTPGGAEPGPGQIAAWHARLVHRNNRYAAYHAQRWMTIERDAGLRPYVQHVCASEPCPICDPLCGRIFTLAEAAQIHGQLHHGCRCSQVSVSALEVEREGLRVAVGHLQHAPD